MTPLPPMNSFLAAYIPLANALEIVRRWPAMSEEERQEIVRALVPPSEVPLSDLLKRRMT